MRNIVTYCGAHTYATEYHAVSKKYFRMLYSPQQYKEFEHIASTRPGLTLERIQSEIHRGQCDEYLPKSQQIMSNYKSSMKSMETVIQRNSKK